MSRGWVFPKGGRDVYCRGLRKGLSLWGRKWDKFLDLRAFEGQPQWRSLYIFLCICTLATKSSQVHHLTFLLIINPYTGLLHTGSIAISRSLVMSLGHYATRSGKSLQGRKSATLKIKGISIWLELLCVTKDLVGGLDKGLKLIRSPCRNEMNVDLWTYSKNHRLEGRKQRLSRSDKCQKWKPKSHNLTIKQKMR